MLNKKRILEPKHYQNKENSKKEKDNKKEDKNIGIINLDETNENLNQSIEEKSKKIKKDKRNKNNKTKEKKNKKKSNNNNNNDKIKNKKIKLKNNKEQELNEITISDNKINNNLNNNNNIKGHQENVKKIIDKNINNNLYSKKNVIKNYKKNKSFDNQKEIKNNNNININTNINQQNKIKINSIPGEKNNTYYPININNHSFQNFNLLGNNLNLNNNNENNYFNNEGLTKCILRDNFDIFRSEEIIPIIPNYCKVFDKIDLFNSLLIMINNISYIYDYFSNNKILNKIIEYEKKHKFCLSSILFYINKYLWYSNNNKKINLSQNDLLKKYKEFIDCYSKKNCNNFNPNEYCYDIKNIEYIVNFIYKKINDEFTEVSQDINNNLYVDKNDSFSLFKWEFSQKNKSIISDHFMGTYQNQVICKICNSSYNYYESFSCISFNINEIYNFYLYNNNNNNFLYNYNYGIYNNNNPYYYNNIYQLKNNKYIDLEYCFNYIFFINNKKCYNLDCKKCNVKTNSQETFSIFTLPNILTIVLYNNENCNLNLEDKLNLKKFIKYGDGEYYLISILCQICYNGKFIIYCINPNNGMWYSYIDKEIIQTDKMDINAIPLMLIYQVKNDICFQYNEIKRDLNKIYFNFNFNFGLTPKKFFFNQNETIKGVINKISSILNLAENNLSIFINGVKVDENRYLNEFCINDNLLIIKN